MHLSSVSTTPRSKGRLARRQKTRELFAQAAGCNAAERGPILDRIIRLNIEVARALARPYAGRGVPLEDLEQVACLALVKAVHQFRPDKAEDFLAYAVPTIRGDLKKHFRDHAWVVRPPRRLQELQAQVTRMRSDLEQSEGHEPDIREIAAALEVDEDDVRAALSTDGCYSPTSLDQPARAADDGGTGAALSDRIGGLDPGYDTAEARVMLRSVLRTLSPRDRVIVERRFIEGATQREIGQEIGVTQMQVSRLLTRILGDLREQLAA